MKVIEEPIRICLLGCGNITRSHAKTLDKSIHQVELSFASRSIEKATEYKNKYKGAGAFDSYDSAIESPQIDVVMINTPPDSHFELARKALETGKHVIVEKPPFMHSSDFDILGRIATESSLHLMVAENYYYKPLRPAIERLLKESSIGQPLFIHINATKKQKSKNDWREDKSITGFGALFEGGIHWINFINNLGLTITNIRGFSPNRDTDLERSIQVTANTEEGTVINLLYSWEVDTLLFGARISKIFGTEGSIGFETNGAFVWIRGSKKRFFLPDIRNITGFKLMFEDFLGALKNGTSPQFTWQMAQRDLQLIEEVYASLST